MADYYLQNYKKNGADTASKEPLFGFMPRRVTAEQVQKAMVRWYHFTPRSKSLILIYQEGDVNPFTKLPHSGTYKKILEVRKKLPVYTQMKEFYEMVSSPANLCS